MYKRVKFVPRWNFQRFLELPCLPSLFTHESFALDPLKWLERFPDPKLNFNAYRLCKSFWPLLVSLWMFDPQQLVISTTEKHLPASHGFWIFFGVILLIGFPTPSQFYAQDFLFYLLKTFDNSLCNQSCENT